MNKLTFVLISLLVFPLTIFAQTWDEEKYKAIEASIVAPKFADAEFDITTFGVTTASTAKEVQTAINDAITKCSEAGGGKVIVPPGVWNTGAITLKDNVNLVVKAGATLLFAYDPYLYPLVKTRWEGLDIMNYSPCIYAYQAKNVAVSGDGIIDGNGSNDTWWKWCGATKFGYEKGVTLQSQANDYAGNEKYKQVDKDGNVKSNRNTLLWMADNNIPTEERVFGLGCGMRPQLINFYECENVLVDGVTLLRSPFWVIHPTLCKNVTVRRCKIINDGPNGDGCDPESCENVLIENCIFHTGDDCIAIKSGRNGDGRRTPRPSKNIIIRGCTMEDGHGGVVIGSEISAGVQNVFAEDCRMDSPNLDRVLRIKTNTCRGGVTDGIFMRNVSVGQCREAVLRINLQYEPNEQAQRGFKPFVKNIYMENVTCKKAANGIMLNGLEDTIAISDISIKNCTFSGVSEKPIIKTGKIGKLKFSKLIINDKLILAKAPYKHYSEWITWSEMKRVKHPFYLDFTDEAKYPNGKWSYVMGIELEGMLDTWRAYQDPDVLKYIKEYPARMIDQNGNVTGYNLSDYNIDNVRPARFILRMNRLFVDDKKTRTMGTERAVANIYTQMQSHPRTQQGKGGRGVFWHKKIYPNQVWLDGIYMGLPFFTMAAEEMEGKEVALQVYDDAVNQIATTFEKTYDEKTGLWKHAWDEKKSMFWANKETGLSQHTWARALGWFAMAMTEVLDVLPEDYARRQEVKDMLQKTMEAVVKYQDQKTGVWYDVLDVKDPKNYLEATASCMFSYVLLKGARLGYIDASFKKDGVKAYDGIIKQFIKINNDKTISLTNCCSVSGLGPEKNPNRDGSFEYYMSEPIRDNDPKGIGPFIWASLEMERDKAETVKLEY